MRALYLCRLSRFEDTYYYDRLGVTPSASERDSWAGQPDQLCMDGGLSVLRGHSVYTFIYTLIIHDMLSSKSLQQPRHRAKNVGCAPTHLFFSFLMFCLKLHSRTHPNEHRHCDHFLKICTTNRRQIRPGGKQMSNKSMLFNISSLQRRLKARWRIYMHILKLKLY